MAGFPSKAKGNQIGEKAKQPRPGVPLNKDDILRLIVKYHGNISKVADSLGSNRYVIRRRCEADADLKQALEDSRERILDELEEVTWQDAIDNKDPAMRCFLLKTRGKSRGYDQDDNKNMAQDIAKAAFDFIINKSKNPAELDK